jgi:hypothetical protein
MEPWIAVRLDERVLRRAGVPRFGVVHPVSRVGPRV